MTKQDGKNIVITGCSSGIGRAAVKRLIAEGHRVLGCARREERLNKMRAEFGDQFVPVQADVSSADDIVKLFKEADKQLGKIDVLINNAGVGIESTILNGTLEEWQQMFDVNVIGLMDCMRKALDRMRQKNSGHIINISSMSAHRVTQGGGVYAASKHAVKALTEGLRQELSAENSAIRVTAISPGFVETEFYDHYYKDLEEKEREALFTEMKALESRDIVEAIVYALEAPGHVGVNDILLRPLQQLS